MRAESVPGLPIAQAREDGTGRGRRPDHASPRHIACRRLRRLWRRSLAALRRATGKDGR